MTTSTTATKPSPSDGATHDPPPAATPHPKAIRSLLRLFPYARPALPALIGSAITATVAMLCGLAFPLVIQRIIDGPIADRRPRRRCGRWPACCSALGVVEAGAVLGAPDAVRPADDARSRPPCGTAIYDHLQQLPVALPRPLAGRVS